MSISNRALFNKAQEVKFEEDPSLLHFILDCKNVQYDAAEEGEFPALDLFLGNFVKLAKKKWREANGKKQIFERKFASWLDLEADIPAVSQKKTPSTTPRKKKEFDELSRRSQNRETQELRSTNATSKLVQAAKTALKNDGEYDFAVLMEKAAETPTRASKLRRLSGIAETMEEVPAKALSLPTKISPTEVLHRSFRRLFKKSAKKISSLLYNKYLSV